MKIGAPTLLLFLISFALACAGVLGRVRPDLVAPDLATYDFWFLVAAYAVLTLGTLKRGDDA